ncbi:carboxypeptidase-like regulatory domain-containing protein [Hymenobacter weizhouensis]|uniref:carboxypeptidase-like regulatory domain-containing protein n=1 Tax=Hymenobacter sp. YIM 151500-1 TaxID=2987689 RepID=UPI0022260B84|nr:carboxypeptidase-like regulatory domain-containing protein [Hymenobacter sp. YIM 151500-1]UYZ62029.1 carboxypeptidase-like regulatory domain-containing protein [Hymenobacter sp. YIM 151500-1]
MKTFFYPLLFAALLVRAGQAVAQDAPAPVLADSAQVSAAPVAPAPEALPASTAATATPPAADADSTTRVLLTGYVLNEQQRPLQGATVLLKGTKEATSTDASGHYTLPVPPGTNTLQYDYAGYQGREVLASNFLPVTVTLMPADKARKRDRQ